MSTLPRPAGVVGSGYNYGRSIASAIESALAPLSTRRSPD